MLGIHRESKEVELAGQWGRGVESDTVPHVSG